MMEQQVGKFTPEDEAALATMLSKKADVITALGMTPYVFANDKTNPAPFGILNMFYEGVFRNTLGIMVAKNVDTGLEESVLVGITKGEDGSTQLYPVAVLLNEITARAYQAPTGDGGYGG